MVKKDNILLITYLILNIYNKNGIKYKKKNKESEWIIIANNLINDDIYCPKCNNELKVNKSNLLFRCRKVLYEKNKHKNMWKNNVTLKQVQKLKHDLAIPNWALNSLWWSSLRDIGCIDENLDTILQSYRKNSVYILCICERV